MVLSQILVVLSSNEPEASVEESGDHAREVTQPVCPGNVAINWSEAVVAFQILMVASLALSRKVSPEPEAFDKASLKPSGDQATALTELL